MCSSINRKTNNEQQATNLRSKHRCTLHIARCTMLLFAIAGFASCSQKQSTATKTFINIDSLVSKQVTSLNGFQLKKTSEIDGKTEETTFTPDTTEWSRELESFRQLDQINKASFRDAYVVSETRDTNSNLMIRELKANRPVPVTSVKFYYLGSIKNLRKIEGEWIEENSLYINKRHVVMDLGISYRIEGSQKMVMSDSVKFVIAGELVQP